MQKYGILPLAVMGMFLTATAAADSLSERRAGKETTSDTTVEVACGKADKENCAIAVPEINTRSVGNHIRLSPLTSQGSVESMNGLCDGDVQIGIVQADVFVTRGDKTDCTGKLSVLGSALYPYYGYMITSAKRSEDSFAKMITNVPAGKVFKIAAGGSGSGGEYTLRVILLAHPEWRNRMSIENDGADTALNKVKDGQLDAFFVMDGPKSPLLQTVTDDLDPKTNKPNFKFVDFRPSEKVSAMKFDNGRLLYATVVLAPGMWSSTKTIATPAITVVRNDYYKQNPDLVGGIRHAAEDALANIAAKAGANPDWKREFTQ